jgi:predicted 2-oxoglutarate/Fe(II)-dependent dioxygenase YbiX
MAARTISIPLLSPEECCNIVQESTHWVEGTVYKFGQFLTNKQFRSVQICNRGISQKLEDRIFKTIFLTNSSSYRYHLEGYNQKDPPLVFKYSADRQDHYVWHTDAMDGDSVRKLSFTIQLTDPTEYSGGDLEFMPAITDKRIKDQGTMTIFPSYMTHRVSPVTHGTRHTIVGWIYGPEFR